METKRKVFLNWLVILLALLVFSGILFFGVYASLSLHGEDVGAYAAEENQVYNFNQLVQYGDFSSSSGWAAYDSSNVQLTISNGVCTCHYLRTGLGYSFSVRRPISVQQGHVVLILQSIFCSSDISFAFDFDGTTRFSTLCSSNEWTVVGGILRVTGSNTRIFCANPRDQVDPSITTILDNVQCFDLTLIYGAGNEPTTIEEFRATFPSEYYDYTTGTLVTPSYDQGYTDGYDLGYTQGYSAGSVRALNSSSVPVFTTKFINFTSPDPVFSNVIQNYYTITGADDDESYISLNVGYFDIFGLNYTDLMNTYISFSWDISTFSFVRGGSFSYVKNIYYSNYVTFDDLTDPYPVVQLYHAYDFGPLADGDLPLYDIRMEMHSSYTLIWANAYSSDYITDPLKSGSCPDFGPNARNPYRIQFFIQSDAGNAYSEGFTEGVLYADSRLNQGSVSYNNGFSEGVSSANKYTFYSLIDSVVLSPIGAIQKALDFEILGTNIKWFYTTLLTLAAVLFIFRLFMGSK